MLRKIIPAIPETGEQPAQLQQVLQALQNIQGQLEADTAHKQVIIDGCFAEIKNLRGLLHDKDAYISSLEIKINDCQKNIEGNRQLINKLLNDLERMQQDIEWYKRTYETRSLFGTIKEKIIGRRIKKNT